MGAFSRELQQQADRATGTGGRGPAAGTAEGSVRGDGDEPRVHRIYARTSVQIVAGDTADEYNVTYGAAAAICSRSAVDGHGSGDVVTLDSADVETWPVAQQDHSELLYLCRSITAPAVATDTAPLPAAGGAGGPGGLAAVQVAVLTMAEPSPDTADGMQVSCRTPPCATDLRWIVLLTVYLRALLFPCFTTVRHVTRGRLGWRGSTASKQRPRISPAAARRDATLSRHCLC